MLHRAGDQPTITFVPAMKSFTQLGADCLFSHSRSDLGASPEMFHTHTSLFKYTRPIMAAVDFGSV